MGLSFEWSILLFLLAISHLQRNVRMPTYVAEHPFQAIACLIEVRLQVDMYRSSHGWWTLTDRNFPALSVNNSGQEFL